MIIAQNMMHVNMHRRQCPIWSELAIVPQIPYFGTDGYASPVAVLIGGCAMPPLKHIEYQPKLAKLILTIVRCHVELGLTAQELECLLAFMIDDWRFAPFNFSEFIPHKISLQLHIPYTVSERIFISLIEKGILTREIVDDHMCQWSDGRRIMYEYSPKPLLDKLEELDKVGKKL